MHNNKLLLLLDCTAITACSPKPEGKKFFSFCKIINHFCEGRECVLKPGMWKRKRKRWKRSFSVEAEAEARKNLPLPLPHRLFDLKSNLAKKFCPFPDVD